MLVPEEEDVMVGRLGLSRQEGLVQVIGIGAELKQDLKV